MLTQSVSLRKTDRDKQCEDIRIFFETDDLNNQVNALRQQRIVIMKFSLITLAVVGSRAERP